MKSAIGCAWACVVILVASLATSHAQVPVAYEDSNNNGVFDSGDVDLTGLIADQLASGWGFDLQSTKSIVVSGAIKVNCLECPSRILAKQNVTINGSLTLNRNGGSLDVDGADISIGNKVQISAVAGVFMAASGSVTIGDDVRFMAMGAHPTKGLGDISLYGSSLRIGQNFSATAAYDVYCDARSADVTIGPKANIASLKGHVSVYAERDITAESAKAIKGPWGVTLHSWSPGTIEAEGSKLISTGVKGVSRVYLSGRAVSFTPHLVTKPRCITVSGQTMCD